MPEDRVAYTIEFRYRGDPEIRLAEAATASAVVTLCDQLGASDAEVVTIKLDGSEVLLGEVKNEAGREAADGRVR